MKYLVAFSTKWGSQHGGINSFNHDLLSAFAAAHDGKVKVFCIVTEMRHDEIKEAKNRNIILIEFNWNEFSKLDKDICRNFLKNILEKEGFNFDQKNIIWLGHDRITGEISLHVRDLFGGKTALIHHMSYEHYEAYAESAEIAQSKIEEQRQLFEKADIVLAVGPLLRDALTDLLNRESIPMLIPGLPEITVKEVKPRFRVFMSGRLSKDANKLKQGYLGISAFGRAVKEASTNAGMPQDLNGKKNPGLILRGVDFENSPKDSDEGVLKNIEDSLKEFGEQCADRAIDLKALPFTTDREMLFNELAGARAALMPSWHEGFGLVGWEAIGAGVPLILTRKSGLYQFLEEHKSGTFANNVISVDVRGKNSEPYFHNEDVINVSDGLLDIAGSDKKWAGRAAILREELAKYFTWARCAVELAENIGWFFEPHSLEDDRPPPDSPPSGAATPLISGGPIELPRPRWQPGRGHSPSLLLQAEEKIIPFDKGREQFLQEHLDLLASITFPIAVQLFTGVGGAGKTRLALELCNRLAQNGWTTGFLKSDASGESIREFLTRQKSKILLVIDYAETRRIQLLTLIKSAQEKSELQLRIVLLARDSGDWWDNLLGEDKDCESILLGTATRGPFRLPALHDNLESRNEAYHIAHRAFADKLALPVRHGSPELTDPLFAHPLHVQMAALLALFGEQPKSAEAVTRALVLHEQRYWKKWLADPADAGSHDDPAILMTLTILSNGFQTQQQAEQLWQDIGRDKARFRKLFPILAQLYPYHRGIQSLRPDLLGEALVAQTLLTSEGEKILTAALSSKRSQHQRRAGLTVLARLLQNRADLMPVLLLALNNTLLDCIQEAISVISETPSSGLPRLLEQAFQHLSIPKKTSLIGQLQNIRLFEIVPLADFSATLWQFQVTQFEKRIKSNKFRDRYQLAHAYHRLSLGVLAQGKFDEALSTAKKSLNIYAKLARNDRQDLNLDWAGSLNNYASILSEVGRFDEALAPAKQAVDINAQLAKNDLAALEPNWAISLNNYANILAEVGQFDEALAQAKQGLDIRARLAESNPARFDPDWAGSLDSYASRLANIGRVDEALGQAEQALDIRARLAKNAPARFELAWAISLNNYANLLSEVGLSDEALAPAHQAVDIYARLAKNTPARFDSDWAVSLGNYANRLVDIGLVNEAMAPAQQAFDIYGKLVKFEPQKFTPREFNAHVRVIYLSWLSLTGSIVAVPELPILLSGSSREWKSSRFARTALVSIVSEDCSVRDAALKEAAGQWSDLDLGLQRQQESLGLLLAALAEAQQLPPLFGEEWRNRLAAYSKQRRNKLPWYMQETARRLKLNLV